MVANQCFKIQISFRPDRRSNGTNRRGEAIKSLRISIESSTMVRKNVAAFGLAVGANVLAVDVEDEDGFKQKKCFC